VKLCIFKDLFRGRTDAYGAGRGQCVKHPLSDTLLLSHLSGKGARIGIYPLSPDIKEGTASWWIAIDFDDGCLETAKKAYATLAELGIQAYIEVSKSKGYHVWVFCSEPIMASDLRTVVAFAMRKANITDYEMFPKQDTLSQDENGDWNYGNYINLPLYGKDIKDGRTTFIDHTDSFLPICDGRIWTLLQDVTRLSQSEINDIIQKHSSKQPSLVFNTTKPHREQTKSVTVQQNKNANNSNAKTQSAFKIEKKLPTNFEALKKCDSLISKLWSTPSKKTTSKGGHETSDYDWALGRACIERGIRNRDELLTILANFPHGKYARDGSLYNLTLTVDKLMQTVKPLPEIDAIDAKEELRKKLHSEIPKLKAGNVLLVRATPGLGKTTEIVDIIKNANGNIILAEPTKETAEEVFGQFSDDTTLLKGRCLDNCPFYDKVKAISKKGYLPGKVFCPGCPYNPQKAGERNCCDYFRQFFGLQRIKVTTYEQALELHFAGKLPADLIVLDEDPTRAFFKRVDIEANQLHFNENAKYPLPQYGKMLRETLHLAEEASKGGTRAFRCREIVKFLQNAAETMNLKEKLFDHLTTVFDCIKNVFDQPARLSQLNDDDIDALPHAHVGEIATALIDELKKGEATDSDSWNSKLTLIVTSGKARFVLRKKREIPTFTPIIILDAYARKGYYSKLLGRDIQMITVEAKVYCEIIQVPLSTSKRAFRHVNKNQKKQRKDCLLDDLFTVSKMYKDRKMLVYTHFELEDEVANMLPFTTIEHFFSGRGKDCYRDYEVALIFGTPEPNPSELYDEARALYFDDSNPISDKQSKFDPRKYEDSRLQELREMRREDEIMQDVHRIRPIWAEGKDKKVIIMSQLYCEHLPPDKIIDPQTLDANTVKRQERYNKLQQLIKESISKLGFYTDILADAAELTKTTDEERRGIATGFIEPSNKYNIIRQSYGASNNGALHYYDIFSAEYRNDRGTILADISVTQGKASIQVDGTWRTFKIWGDAGKAKAIFAEVLERQEETASATAACMMPVVPLTDNERGITVYPDFKELIEAVSLCQEPPKVTIIRVVKAPALKRGDETTHKFFRVNP
jgi:hypothetical protein